jgi:hypothetical protein
MCLKSRSTKIALLIGISMAPPLACAEGDSPWLPVPRSGSISASYVTQNASNIYIGDQLSTVSDATSNAASKFQRSAFTVGGSYGISDEFSVDAKVGSGSVKVGDADKSGGRTDAVIGANWRALDEFEAGSFPTVTLRAAAILKGSYNGDRLASLGKAANGFEMSVLVGKQLAREVRVWGELGFQNRSKQVPRATIIEVNGSYTFTPVVSAYAGFSLTRFSGDLDIAGQGFTLGAYQQVREERNTLRAGLNLSVASNQAAGVSFAKVLSGRNTVKDDSIVGVSYTYGF